MDEVAEGELENPGVAVIPPALLAFLVVAAPSPRRVGLTASGCDTAFVTEVRQLLAIELKATVGALLDSADETVALACAGDSVAVDVRRAGAPVQSLSVDVSSVGDEFRARTVALLLAETMTSPPPTVAPVAPKPPPVELAPRASTPAPARSAMFTAGFVVRTLERPQLGASIGVELALSRWFGLHVDLVGLTATVPRAGGRVQATSFDVGPGVDVRLILDTVTLRAGPGVRLGVSLLEGRAAEGRIAGTVAGLMWGPQLALGARVAPARLGVAFTVALEAGWWAPKLTGEVFGEGPVEVAGPFGALTVGVGWLP